MAERRGRIKTRTQLKPINTLRSREHVSCRLNVCVEDSSSTSAVQDSHIFSPFGLNRSGLHWWTDRVRVREKLWFLATDASRCRQGLIRWGWEEWTMWGNCMSMCMFGGSRAIAATDSFLICEHSFKDFATENCAIYQQSSWAEKIALQAS